MKKLTILLLIITVSCDFQTEKPKKNKKEHVVLKTERYGFDEVKVYDKIITQVVDTVSKGIVPIVFQNPCFEQDFCEKTEGIWTLYSIKRQIILKIKNKVVLEYIIKHKEIYNQKCDFDIHTYQRPIHKTYKNESIWELAFEQMIFLKKSIN